MTGQPMETLIEAIGTEAILIRVVRVVIGKIMKMVELRKIAIIEISMAKKIDIGEILFYA